MKFQIQDTGRMKRFISVFIIFIMFYALKTTSAQDAPICTIGNEVTTGLNVNVAITATGFNDVTNCNLRLIYDPLIANAVSVTRHAQMGGSLDVNLEESGQIKLSWSTFPWVNLPDGSTIFNITFEKVDNGNSLVAWDEDYQYMHWGGYYNNALITFNHDPFEEYYVDGSVTFQGTAPHTSTPHLAFCPGSMIDVPVTVEHFNTIGAFNLTMHYNDVVLVYTGFTNTSGFPGLEVFNPNNGVLTSSGVTEDPNGFTLPANTVLYTLHFSYSSTGGSSFLEWYDSDLSSCAYAGPYPDHVPLYDLPQENYYINGSVSPAPTAEIKVFLEGLYNTAAGNMNKTKDFDGTNIVDKFNGTIADLITIELHEPANYGAPIRTFQDIPLHQDGTASFCADGVSGSYYLTVVTRNHLETVSTNPVDFSSTVDYDFTTAATQACGSNMKQLAAGVWGIYAGDVDQNGIVNTNDINPTILQFRSFGQGYVNEDINGDGIINTQDINIIIFGFRSFVEKQIP